MPQSNSLSARRTRILVSFTLFITVLARAEVSDGARTQIDSALGAALQAKIEQHYPDLGPGNGRYDFDLRSIAATLAPCSSGVDVDWRGQDLGGRMTPRVSCHSEGWQLYVPVSVEIRRPVVVSASHLDRGQRLDAGDLSLKTLDIATLRQGYFETPEDVAGYQIRRSLGPGQVITPRIAEPPLMIRRGDRVRIIARTGPLAVSTQGEALRDGEDGRQIPVRNLSSGETVHAYVVERGVVEINRR